MTRPLRIAQVAPPMERVPPRAYGGTERVVYELVRELDRRGHTVTTFASRDSDVPGTLVPTVDEALRPSGYSGDASPWFYLTIQQVLDQAAEFDIIHSHLEWANVLLARVSPIPVVSTFHGRLDVAWAAATLARPMPGLVAISASQAATHPDVDWAGVVHNGLTLDDSPFDRRRGDALCFVGRVAPEKGIVEAIEIAKVSGRPLRIAAKAGPMAAERDYFNNIFMPAVEAAGSSIEFLGELEQGDRDLLFAESYAALMPGSWPEPFGLVAIEALACGTPVIARRVGGLPEIIRDGIDGFFGDDVDQLAYQVDRIGTLDRAAIRASVLERFSAGRMTDGYEAIYRTMLAFAGSAGEAGAGREAAGTGSSSGRFGGSAGYSGGRGGEPRPLKPVMSDAPDLAASGRAS
jgi:glycosyltransferase involved in cell wall biosynthesis